MKNHHVLPGGTVRRALVILSAICFLPALAIAEVTSPVTPTTRTITGTGGRKMEVTILEKSATAIKAKRISDGKEFTFELAKLSADDRAFITGLAAPVAPPVKQRTALLLGFSEIQTQLEKAGFVVTKAPTESVNEDPLGTPSRVSIKYTTIAQFTDEQIKSYDLIWASSRGQRKTEERLTTLIPSYKGIIVWAEKWDRTRELLIKNQEKKFKPYSKATAYMKPDGNVIFYSTTTSQWNTKTDNVEVLEEHPEMMEQAIVEAKRILGTR